MVIFDFDQTLVDTKPVELLRKARNWKGVMARAPQLSVYPGISELLGLLHERGEPLAIVTKSPDMVPRSFVRLHKWPIDIVVGYHQVANRKPHPEGLLRAMKQASALPGQTFHVGDQPEDTEASRSAGVTAIGVTWGIDDEKLLVESQPDFVFNNVADLQSFLVKGG